MSEVKLMLCKKHGLTEFSLRKDGKYRCKKCASERVDDRRRKLKHELVQYKGGKCEICGYDKCEAALDFHHLNPEEKELQLSSGKTHSLKKMKLEADKCILVCANCHREIHDKINQNKRNDRNKEYEINEKKYNYNYQKLNCKQVQLNIEEIQNYIDNGLNQKEIAKKCNVSLSTLKRFLKIHEISTKKVPYNIDEMVNLMKKYKNYTKVAKELGISDNAVKKRFKRHGYPNKLKDLLKILDS